MLSIDSIGRPHDDNADGGRPANAVAPAVGTDVTVDMVAHCTGLLHVAVSVVVTVMLAVRFDHHHQRRQRHSQKGRSVPSSAIVVGCYRLVG